MTSVCHNNSPFVDALRPAGYQSQARNRLGSLTGHRGVCVSCHNGEGVWKTNSPRTWSTNGVVWAGDKRKSGRDGVLHSVSSRVAKHQSDRRFTDARLGATACMGSAASNTWIFLDCFPRTARLTISRMTWLIRSLNLGSLSLTNPVGIPNSPAYQLSVSS